ncbi:MAG: Two component signal transduction histidine kinase [Acidimicrobiales bacterium]|nr:Two component signal transduction histidine kinase [Acidimicrobiales bacterium]
MHGTSLIVLVIGLLATGSLAVAALVTHGNNEDRLLRQRVREAGAVFTAAIPSLQTPLAAAAELAEETNASGAAFLRTMESQVGDTPDRRYVSASIWLADGTRLTPLSVVGRQPALASSPPNTIRAVLTRAGRTVPPGRAGGLPAVGVSGLLSGPSPRLGYSWASARPLHRYVVYAETALPANRTRRPQADSAFSGLDYALYLGPTPRASALLIASASAPLRGRTQSVIVPFGDAQLLLVMHPTEDLGGSLMRLLPWLIAGIGALVSLGFAVLVERVLRRRDYAQELAGELGAVAEENARLYADQRSLAQMLQQSLLPESLPSVPGVELGVRYEPGVEGLDIGGDWYDVVPVGERHVLLVVGDVSGRGLRAATIMASLRYSIRAYAAQGDGPSEILQKLSRLLHVERDNHFATVLCARIDLETRTLELASAGHPDPLLIDAAGARYVDVRVGVPVGVSPDGPYESVHVDVPPSATMLAFTDGLFERRGETIDVGLERLRQTAAEQEGSLDELLSSLYQALSEAGSHDDTAILGVRWTT